MKLSDGTIVNEPIRFLGTIREIVDKQGAVVGCYFSFNSRKMYYDEVAKAEKIREEIIKVVPEAIPMEFRSPEKKEWEEPSLAETA